MRQEPNADKTPRQDLALAQTTRTMVLGRLVGSCITFSYNQLRVVLQNM